MPRGSGASMISPVSDWNSRTSWSGGVLLGSKRAERNDFMRVRSGVQVPVLQVPQPGIDVTALEQFGVGADVVDLAALDADSEAIVNANLLRIAQGRTLIIISHRLSSLVMADQIVE